MRWADGVTLQVVPRKGVTRGWIRSPVRGSKESSVECDKYAFTSYLYSFLASNLTGKEGEGVCHYKPQSLLLVRLQMLLGKVKVKDYDRDEPNRFSGEVVREDSKDTVSWYWLHGHPRIPSCST